MAKVIAIIENDPILGVKYGTIEVPETEIETNDIKNATAHAETLARVQSVQTQKFRANNTKHK